MSCDACQPQITALADGELSPLAAWRVRRHLAHCPACAALYAEITQVSAVAHAFAQATADPIPAGFADRVHRHLAVSPLPAPRERAEITGPVFDSQEISMPASPVVSHRPFANLNAVPRLRSLAAATVVLIAPVGVGTHILIPGKPPVAFADVRRAVQQVTTAHIRYRVTPQGTGEEVQAFEAWLRTDPPGFVMLMGEGIRLVGDQNGTVLYPGDGNGKPIHVSDAKITRADIASFLLSPDELLKQKGGHPGASADNWSAPEWITLPNGTRVLRFHREKQGTCVILLADPETRRPVHLELQMVADNPESGATLVEVDFAYNETPPPAIF